MASGDGDAPVGRDGAAPLGGDGAAPLSSSARTPRPWPAWHVAFFGLLVASYAAVIAGTDLATAGGWLAAAGLTVLALAYLLLIMVAKAQPRDRHVVAYLIVAVIVLTIAVAGDPGASIMYIAVFTHTWAFTGSRRLGMGFSAALAIGEVVAISVAGGFGVDGWLGGVITGVASFGFSVAMGLTVLGAIRRVERRALLERELADTRNQLERVQWAESIGRERERLAQDVHDTLAQGFTSIVMLSQLAAEELRQHHVERAAGRIDVIEDTARANLAEARALVASYAPIDLHERGVVEALDRLARRFAAETGIAVDVHCEPISLPPATKAALVRASQEALANVRKHSGADSVDVVLAVDPNGYRLTITDNGIGLTDDFQPGIGLESMAARMGGVGGSVSWTAAVGGAGLRLDIVVPDATGQEGSS